MIIDAFNIEERLLFYKDNLDRKVKVFNDILDYLLKNAPKDLSIESYMGVLRIVIKEIFVKDLEIESFKN